MIKINPIFSCAIAIMSFGSSNAWSVTTNIGISPCNSGAIICNATSQNDVTVSGAGTVTSVWEGGSISNNTVKDSGVINIQNNGTADKTNVDVSGTLNVNRGGLSSNLLLSGGKVNINVGGVANDSTITTSGLLAVSGVVNRTIVNSGTLSIYPGGIANDTTVNGGRLDNNKGTINGTILNAGTINLSSTATAKNTTLNGGRMNVKAGNTVDILTLGSGGYLSVDYGATVTNITQLVGGRLYTSSKSNLSGVNRLGAFYSDGTTNLSDNILLENGGWFDVKAGGLSTNATVLAGGILNVIQNSEVRGAVIEKGGILGMSAGSIASGIVLQSGSAIDADTDSAISGTNSLGTFSIDAGTHVANNVLLENGVDGQGYGAELRVLSNGVANDTTVNSRGTLILNAGSVLTGKTRINNNGTLSARDNLITNNGELIFNQESNQVVSADINGLGSLTKDGVNTLTLKGSNSYYSGGTYLKGGALALAGSSLISDVAGVEGTRLVLQDSSQLTGRIDPIDVDVLSGSLWNMTADSQVNDLYLNEGTVVFTTPAVTDEHHTLMITGDLSGHGTLVLNTDLSTLRGDQIKINGQTTGTHTLVIEDTGLEPSGGNKLALVNGNGGNGTFSLYNDHVDVGAFRYLLEKQDNNWYLANAASSTVPEHPVEPKPEPEPEPKPENLSKGANAAIAAHIASSEMWSAQMNSLVKRMGELRLGDDQGGVWSSAIGKRINVSENASRAYSQNIKGLDLGADKAIIMKSGKIYVGGIIGTAKSDLALGEGASGDIENRSLGGYATYVDDSGVYIGGVVKYNRADNEIKILTNLGKTVKGSYSSNGVGVDITVGKHIKLDGGWFVEPIVELTATRDQNADYSVSNGLTVKSEAMNSLQSRLGSKLGRSLQLDNGMNIHPYAEVSYVTEHAGTSNTWVNGNKLRADLPSSRAELGFGGVVQITKNNTVSLGVEYAKGHSMEEPWGGNLSYRYIW